MRSLKENGVRVEGSLVERKVEKNEPGRISTEYLIKPTRPTEGYVSIGTGNICQTRDRSRAFSTLSSAKSVDEASSIRSCYNLIFAGAHKHIQLQMHHHCRDGASSSTIVLGAADTPLHGHVGEKSLIHFSSPDKAETLLEAPSAMRCVCHTLDLAGLTPKVIVYR
ncbi:phospholipase D [Anopheles sinensis]|uniref:Phospholipase D n=1 Tax=Anopheles sinensis TaxID=74873 RepID=A0A084WLK3_ANOSI|nr:phospholipase D [Anopheles sinensis]